MIMSMMIRGSPRSTTMFVVGGEKQGESGHGKVWRERRRNPTANFVDRRNPMDTHVNEVARKAVVVRRRLILKRIVKRITSRGVVVVRPLVAIAPTIVRNGRRIS